MMDEDRQRSRPRARTHTQNNGGRRRSERPRRGLIKQIWRSLARDGGGDTRK